MNGSFLTVPCVGQFAVKDEWYGIFATASGANSSLLLPGTVNLALLPYREVVQHYDGFLLVE
ncbi:MAG: hypothetical protein CMJ42_17015 [Phyllobacteriaceae bacterium]|nr:hypothetical protein [Phyllobacteriaceae bacterium]MBA92304.1 hypothetical protein [Phyllobacteriaceae bacterium]